ncbi:alpha-amylase family glycosyl hydrolase [Amycolatopsis sp.]|uniref:alpha-amylase family glycosyl hydrolase n=1 Tax=Amycolatopsis sp. TaxID=37632 RepID=UPI002D152CFD|nr:alpha-amylase family glycosyl hydrolase [Amycolatopsis sp.]HVV08556.1 alpha-amylase family glycosyl hydrolase [Amycolatopsis sp.]
MTPWAEHAIWWQIYPLGFTGAPAAATGEPPRHRLRQLENWLDYAVELGCSGLLLGPVFDSETHGYDTIDHFRVDPRLGDDADFDRLVASAGERGLRIVLDGVFNHVGRGFKPFAEGRKWFRRKGSEVEVFEGHAHLVKLDHELPEVAGYVTGVLNHWLDRGISGWRLDAAYAIPPEFWRRVLPPVREKHPDAWFVGEVLHGDYVAYVERSGLDTVTQYELWKAVWSSLNDANFFELSWALKRHDAMLETFPPQTFIGNHDVTRLASQLNDERHTGHALALLLTVGGVPSIYYGDEQAFRGVKEERAGGDDAIRPVFPATPAELAPFGWPMYRLHQRLIGMRRRHAWLVRARSEILHLTNRAVAVRSHSPEGEVLTLLNVGDEPYRFPIATGGLTVIGSPVPGDGGDPAVVAGHSWAVLSRE